MILFVPGRHHLLTSFQFEYLSKLVQQGLQAAPRIRSSHSDVRLDAKVSGIIFAVTSSNHCGTRRNPIPFYLRALAAHEFGKSFEVPTHVYGVNDVGVIDRFAEFTIKTVDHESGGRFDLSPDNTVVVCSTPVAEGYLEAGYRVATAEQGQSDSYEFEQPLPWFWVERIALDPESLFSSEVQAAVHESSLRVWRDYALDQYASEVFSDPIVGDDGDLTESRDYSSYVRAMDEIAALKFGDTAGYVRPGRIGDIGCAVGSWLKFACEHSTLIESDFYGIEVARPLFEVCMQRKLNGEFSSPTVFFRRKNAVSGYCFQPNSMDTIHTGSLTHEIESYGSRQELLRFIRHRYDELKPGGVWINRDVVGPEDADREVWLWLDDRDGAEHGEPPSRQREPLSSWLNSLSTFARFLQFARDFRRDEGEPVQYEILNVGDRQLIRASLRDVAEFLLTKDYTTNWNSEMHERFCFWDFHDWTQALESSGFRIHPESRAYRNPWIVENRFAGRAEIYEPETMSRIDFPPTNLLIIAEKV